MSHLAVAIVAVLVVGGTTAVAAKLITGKQIKDGSIKLKDISKSAQKSLAGKDGADGSPGGAGAPGTNGTPGADGVAGPTLFAASIGYDTSNPSVFQVPGTGGQATMENTAQAPIPPGGAFTARSLSVQLNNPPGASNSVEISLRINGVDTALECTIAHPATSCSTPAATEVVVPAGALISMQSSIAQGGGASFGQAGYTFRGEF
jgi:hypothetical protein